MEFEEEEREWVEMVEWVVDDDDEKQEEDEEELEDGDAGEGADLLILIGICLELGDLGWVLGF